MNPDKIGKLIKMLSSPNDGEVVAAARAIMRALEAEGADIHELAERVEGRKLSQAEMQRIYDMAFVDGKNAAAANAGFSDVDGSSGPSFHEMACEIIREENGRLNPKEREFVEDIRCVSC